MKTSQLMSCAIGSLLLFTVAAASASHAPKLKLKFKGNNVPGAQQTLPEGINNTDVTVGQYQDSSGIYHGYILQGSSVTTLDHPQGSNTMANGLPYNGGTANVVGVYTNSVGNLEGFLYNNGTFTDIPGPSGAVSSVAQAINDNGQIAGWFLDSNGLAHGFLLEGTTYTTIDVPGATNGSYAMGINNKGVIALSWFDSNGFQNASLYNGKTFRNIDVPGSVNSWVNGIDNQDDAVFVLTDGNGLQHGALCTQCDSRKLRQYYKFNHPNTVNTYGDGINDKQTISGGYQNQITGPWLGFEATYK